MTTSKWTPQDLPRLDGRTFVITGANSGIGLVAARELGRAGARVVLAVRDPATGEQAAATIDGETEVRQLDLADLASVRAFAEAWDGRPRRAGQQRRRDGRPRAPHQGRLRDADRHQPPRPLRADQPAAAARHATASSSVSSGAHRIGLDPTSTTSTGSAGGYQPLARLRAVQARQPAVHDRAAAPARRGRLERPRRRRPSRLRGDQPPAPHRERRSRTRSWPSATA